MQLDNTRINQKNINGDVFRPAELTNRKDLPYMSIKQQHFWPFGLPISNTPM